MLENIRNPKEGMYILNDSVVLYYMFEKSEHLMEFNPGTISEADAEELVKEFFSELKLLESNSNL